MRNLVLGVGFLLAGFVGTGAGQDYPWCATMDQVFATEEHGLLTLVHRNATYNCCVDSFAFTVTTSHDSLYVTEREVLAMPCDCMCCYDLAAEVTGLAPGQWQVVYRWLDDQPWGWRDWPLTVTVGESSLPAFGPNVRSQASGCLDPTGMPEAPDVPVVGAVLRQNAPNPFNPGTTIGFEVTARTVASLRVYDVAGRLVRVLLSDGIVAPGPSTVVWNGCDDAGAPVASGTYFYRLEIGAYHATRRMVRVN